MSSNAQRKIWVVNKKCDIVSTVIILSSVIVSCLAQNSSYGNELFRQSSDGEVSNNISEPKMASLKMNTIISDSAVSSVNIQRENNNNENSSEKGHVKSVIQEDGVSIENVGSVERDPIISQFAPTRGNKSWDEDVWTKFSWLSDLYNHHEWSMRHYSNVTKACAHTMTIYLDALKKGEVWAAKMSDASGRYNGQFFFGNDFWLGSSGLCAELRLEHLADAEKAPKHDAQNHQSSRKSPPFLASFSVARLQMLVGDLTPQSRILLMGVCLPASCNADDLKEILRNSAMEAEKAAQDKMAAAQPQDGSVPQETVELKVIVVRPVPGSYNMWEDVKFFIFGGVGAIIVCIVLIASVYEAYVDSRNNKSDGSRDVTRGNDCAGKNGAKARKEDPEIECQNNNVSTTHGTSCSSNGGNSSPNGENGNVNQTRRRKLGTDVFSQILLSFSALSNTEKIMKTEDSAEDVINCIHGLRFMSLAWVIMVHTYLQLFAVADNKTLRLVIERNFFYQTVGNASYSVDTFFFISGLLVTFLYHKSQEAKKATLAKRQAKMNTHNVSNPNGNHFPSSGANDRAKNQTHQYAYVNPAMAQQNLSYVDHLAADRPIAGPEQFQITNPVFTRQTCTEEVKDNISEFTMLLFYRIVRLTPAYLFTIGINELALRYSHNNSVFEPTILDHINCDRYWWRNILYINNLYPQTEMCMLWSWYMANDTQFYVIGITLLLLSKRHFKLSSIILITLMISSWLTSGYISIANNYHAKIQEPFEMFDQLYDKPWSRLGPYLIGMITGWYLWRTRGSPQSAKWVRALGWPCSLGIMASLIYGMRDGHLDLWPTAFYVSIGHTAWGVSLAWLVISCTRNRDGLLSKALSYRGALPLSRLAYCAYLVHPTIMMISTFQMDGPVHLHNGIVLIIYAGNTVMSYLMSFAISLAFEAPVVRLLKIDFRNRNKKNN